MISNKIWAALTATGTLLFSLPGFSVNPCSGFFLGAQVGVTRAHYDLQTFVDRDIKEDERAARAYFGYQFNQYFGIETGLTLIDGTHLPEDYGHVKTSVWDLLFKLGAALGDSGLRVDLKGGAAHLMSEFDAHHLGKTAGLDDDKKWLIRPVTGASLTYNVNKNFAIDATYLHVYSDPDHNSFEPPTMDMALLGLSVLFTAS
jgi:hypothetical protein